MTFIAPHYNKARKSSLLRFLKQDRFFVRTPGWLKMLYPHCQWDVQPKEKVLYITFDDGPHPSITPFVLEQLRKYNAKATFFCIGDNVVKYPDVYKQILEEGHAVGNHTQHHINGWKSDDIAYQKDIEDASVHIASHLFRPPYGRISRSQIKKLKEKKAPDQAHYSVIMWNILAGDWVQELSPESCYARIKRRIKAGDIIVFHDSDKAWDRMSYCLPRVLEEFDNQSFSFGKII